MRAFKHISIVAVSLMLTAPSFAQNEQDALFLSRDEVTGSARSVALGGAFTALGGDISGVYSNPAGIGVYRNNTFSISGAFHTIIVLSDYYGNSVLDSKTNINIPTMGIVGVNEIKASKWRSTGMAFGMHRNMSYHRNYSISSNDIPSSLIDSYLQTIYDNDIQPSELPSYTFDLGLAWNTYLIDTINGYWYNAAGVLPVDQSYRVEESGAKRETFFSFGGNYDDKLYVGANVNFSRINFQREYAHSEDINPDDTLTVLREFTFNYGEEISGLGAGISAGLIYRPITPLRLGLSIKSPTVYSLDLVYSSWMVSTFTEGRVFTAPDYDFTGNYKFRLTTPAKANLGIAYVIGKYGLISADAEFVNYTGIRMQGISDFYNFNAEENAIRNNLQAGVNLKLGAEYRVTSEWTLRGGFAHFGDPYSSSLVDQGAFQLYSLGFGYRTEDFFIDAAYQLKTQNSIRYLYNPDLVEPADLSSTDNRITATFGFKF